jgi:hypothetical protein
MTEQVPTQLNIGHLKNVLLLARHGIAAIGAKLPAQEGKAAFESLGEVEKFVLDFEKQQQQAAVPQKVEEPFEVHTVKIQ